MGQHDVHFYGCVVYVTPGSIRLVWVWVWWVGVVSPCVGVVCGCGVGGWVWVWYVGGCGMWVWCGCVWCGCGWVGVHCEFSPHPPPSFRSSHCPAKQALLAAKFRAEYEQLPQATLVSSVHLSHTYEGWDGACCGQ